MREAIEALTDDSAVSFFVVFSRKKRKESYYGKALIHL